MRRTTEDFTGLLGKLDLDESRRTSIVRLVEAGEHTSAFEALAETVATRATDVPTRLALVRIGARWRVSEKHMGMVILPVAR